MSENLVFAATDNVNDGNAFRVFALEVASLPGAFIIQSTNNKRGEYSVSSVLLSRNEIEALRDALTAELKRQDVSYIMDHLL